MTKREEFEKAIRTLRKMQNEQLLDVEDWTIYDIIQFLERAKPKPYESRAKAKCVCGNSGRNLQIWYGFANNTNLYQIRCDNCGRTTSKWCKTKIEATRDWNELASQTRN